MLGVKNFKWLIVFITALFVISTSIHPVAYAGGLKFGIISVVKDKIEELKKKKREEEKRKEEIKYYKSTTNSDGMASFTLDNGQTVSVKVTDQITESSLSDIQVFLITNGAGEGGFYFFFDSNGKYISRIVTASSSQKGSTSSDRTTTGIGIFKEIGLFLSGMAGGNKPDSLYIDIVDFPYVNYFQGKFLIYWRSTQLKELAPSLAQLIKEEAIGTVITSVVLHLLDKTGGVVGIATTVLEAVIVGYYKYYRDYYVTEGYSDDDWFDIYIGWSPDILDLVSPLAMPQLEIFVYPRASVPEAVATNSIGGTITDSETGKPLNGVAVSLFPNPTRQPGSLTLYTGLTGTYIFSNVRDNPVDTMTSVLYYNIQAVKPGYYVGRLLGVEPETTDANISLTPCTNVGSISGKVTESDGVTPVSGAYVEALQEFPSPPMGHEIKSYTRTGIDGTYTLSNLNEGTYYVRAFKIDDRGGYVKNVNVDGGIAKSEINVLLNYEYNIYQGSWVKLSSGILNGVTIKPSNPVLSVKSGRDINGSLNISVTNTGPGASIFPVTVTPSWGDHSNSFWTVTNHSSPGTQNYIVNVDLTAPVITGLYYIIIAAAWELDAGDIMSATNWTYGTEIWNDGNDIASWSFVQIDEAISKGYAQCVWVTGEGYYLRVYIPATAVMINVVP